MRVEVMHGLVVRTLVGFTLAGVALCSVGCPAGSGEAPAVIENRIVGTLAGTLGASPRNVEVYDFQDGVRGRRVCAAESGTDGRWSCDLGPLYGAFVVLVGVDRHAPISRVLYDVPNRSNEMAQDPDPVVVSAITHLTASYAGHLMRQGIGLGESIEKSERLIHAHFGGVDHARTRPAALDGSLSTALTDSLKSAVLVAALERHALEMSKAGGRFSDDNSVWALVSALASDIGEDGRFDGLSAGRPLVASGVALSPETLRTDYARALLSFVDSDANPTRFSGSDFASIANTIATNESEIFVQRDGLALDDRGPTITSITVTDPDGLALNPEVAVRGNFVLQVNSSDESGVAGVSVRLEGAPPGSVGPNLSPSPATARFPVDGHALGDGRWTASIVVVDGAGNRTHRDFGLLVDVTPPVMDIAPINAVRDTTVRIRGTVRDVTSGVVLVRALQDGRVVGAVSGSSPASESASVPGPDAGAGQMARPIAEPGSTTAFEFDAEVRCDARVVLQVEAIDTAGNVARQPLSFVCDQRAPRIELMRTTFVQETSGSIDARYDPAGQLAYVRSTTPTQLVLDETSVFPVELTKYFTRLDLGSDNLPKLALRIRDDDAAADGSEIDVAYRYSVDGVEHRPWTRLDMTSVVQRRHDLELSYQTLGSQLGDGRQDALHQVEVRAIDAAGNVAVRTFEFTMVLRSPPVLLSGCRLDPGLSGFSLAGHNLADLYRSPPPASTPPSSPRGPGSDWSVLTAEVRYALDLDASSMAPTGGVSVEFPPTPVVSKIIELSEDKHVGGRPASSALWCLGIRHRLLDARTQDDLGCFDGLFPESRVIWSRDVDGPVSDEVLHAVAVSLSRATSPGSATMPTGPAVPMNPAALGLRDITADRAHHVEVRVLQPRLTVGGTHYDWPTHVSLPPGYQASSSPPRYRLPDEWGHSGIDWPEFGQTPHVFVARPYISGFAIEAGPLVLRVEHESLPVTVAVQRAPECASPLTYITRL